MGLERGRRRAGGTAAAVDRLAVAGRLDAAIDLAQDVLSTPGLGEEPAARLRLTLSSLLLAVGRTSEAVAETDAVLAQARLPDDIYVEADVDRLIGLVAMGDIPSARARAEAILAGDAHPADDGDLAGALAVIALTAWHEGRAADALRMLNAAARRAEQGPLAVRQLNPRLGTAVVLAALGDFDAAEAAVEVARKEVSAGGDRIWAAGPAVVGAWVHLARGHVDDAVAAAQAGLDVSDELGSEFFRSSANWVLGTVALHRGDLVEAARRVGAYQRADRPFSGGLSQGAYIWLAGRVAEAQGRDELAADILHPLYDRLQAHRRLLVDEPAAAPWLVRAAVSWGDIRRAESVVVCSDHVAAINPGVPTLAAAAAHARGVLARDASVVAAAASVHRHPWARASAHEDAGVLLAEAGQPEEAAGQLAAALQSYEQAGGTRGAARVRARMRGPGCGRHRRGERLVSGWASLTDAERRVAWVVAEGRTNAQAAADLYLSRHTVDFHLRQIYRKLGIGSRVELARIVADRAPDHR